MAKSFHLFLSPLLSSRLVIFPISGNNIFETSDFADQHFSFRNSDNGSFSPTLFLWKKILQNIKDMISFFDSNEFFFFRQRANTVKHKRNFLGV